MSQATASQITVSQITVSQIAMQDPFRSRRRIGGPPAPGNP
jgi:hypothetical protein